MQRIHNTGLMSSESRTRREEAVLTSPRRALRRGARNRPIRLTTVGDGEEPPFVVVHGLGGSRRTFARLAPELRDHRVVLVDLPDLGSVQSQGAMLAARLRARGIKEAILVGHSRGGVVAVAAAELDPRLVRSLHLVDTPPSTKTRTAARSKAERLVAVPAVGHLAWALVRAGGARRALRTAVAREASVPDVMVDDLKRLHRGAFLDQTSTLDRFLARASVPERLVGLDGRITVHVTFGAGDLRVDARKALAEYAGVPGVRTNELTSVGHSPPLEAPHELAALLRDQVTA